MEIPDAKRAVDKQWEKLEKVLAWQLMKVRNKKEVIDEARNKTKRESTLLHEWTSVISRIRSRDQISKNTKVELYSEVTL